MLYRKMQSLSYRTRAFFYRRSATWKTSPLNVPPPAADFDAVDQTLAAAGCRIRDFVVMRKEYEAFKREMAFPPLYALGCRDKKLLEHFISFSLLKPQFGHTYIDVGSQDSPFAKALCRMNVNAFSHDIEYRPGIHGRRIGSGADRLPVPDASVDCVSLQCTFEHFNGTVDTLFIKELGRILRPQGKCCIVPLYLSERLVNYVDPLCDRAEIALDEGAEVVGEVQLGGAFERTYSPEALVWRVLQAEPRLTHTLYRVRNAGAVADSPQTRRVRYALLIEKKTTAQPRAVH